MREMMRDGWARRVARAAAMLALSTAGACAYGPLDGDEITDGKAYFKGFAVEPEANVRVQAFRWSTGQWTTFGTVKASAQPHGEFSTPLYQWYVYPLIPGWAFNAQNDARLRAEEQIGDAWVSMYMYDYAGWECLVELYGEELTDGDDEKFDARNAGIQCSDDGAGNPRHEVRVHR
jgi:hypothetical protein